MDEKNKQSSRRKFIQQTAIAGAAVLLANPLKAFSQINIETTTRRHFKAECY